MGKAGSTRLGYSSIFNVRDIGGYATPLGRVLSRRFVRASDTLALSAEERDALVAYGVRRVVDLRSSIEQPDLTDRMAHVEGVAWLNAPIADDHTMTPESMGGRSVVDFVVEEHRRMLDSRQSIRAAIEFMAQAQPHECVLFHCSAGLDRTGLVSMLVLGAAGVTTNDLVADYAYGFAPDKEVDELLAAWDLSAPYCTHDGVKARISAMYALLAWIEATYGSVRNLLVDYGVATKTIDALVAHAIR